MKVSVIGAGTMGHGIAQLFAMSGYSVDLIDLDEKALESAEQKIHKSLAKLYEKGKVESVDTVLGNIKLCTDISEAGDSGLVVEAVSEKIEVKQKVFSRLSGICDPESIFASNTSSIPIDILAGFIESPQRMIGMHFFNPPVMMSLVEVIVSGRTSNETVEKIRSIASGLGKVPVVVKDSPGFITSRLGMVMINEAVECLDQGLASKEDIDKAMRLGFGHPMGPLELADLIGLDVVAQILNRMMEKFQDKRYKPSRLLLSKISKGEIGKKAGTGFYDYL